MSSTEAITVKGQTVLFSKQDKRKILAHKWVILNGYAYTQRFTHKCESCKQRVRQTISMHRLIMTDAGTNEVVDHINGNRLDNRRENLRVVTQAENRQRARQPLARELPRGVRVFAGSRYTARITVKGESYNLGQYSTAEEAAAAYDKASAQYYGEHGFRNSND